MQIKTKPTRIEMIGTSIYIGAYLTMWYLYGWRLPLLFTLMLWAYQCIFVERLFRISNDLNETLEDGEIRSNKTRSNNQDN